MNKKLISGILRLSRPFNVLISVLSIFVAAFITGILEPWYKVILACASGGFIMAAANTINDFFDEEIDSINKPYRPIPSGLILPQSAFLIAMVEFVVGLSLSLFINDLAFLIAFTFSIILFFYSFKLKRLPLWGNLTVSITTAMAFIYGGIAVNRIKETLIPAGIAFFYHFGREIIKDIQDVKGDAVSSARTFPLLFGTKAALIVATIALIFLLAITLLPYLYRIYGINYFLVILIGVYPIVGYSIFSIWKNNSTRNLGIVSNLLKVDMIIGLFAIYLG